MGTNTKSRSQSVDYQSSHVLNAYQDAFVDAMVLLSGIWDNERLDKDYPFHKSFDELLMDVMNWQRECQQGDNPDTIKTHVRMVRFGGRYGPVIEDERILWQTVIDENIKASDDPFWSDSTITDRLLRDGKIEIDDCTFYLLGEWGRK